MKRPRFFVVVPILMLLAFTEIATAQIGINTTTPRKTLEVAGDMNTSNNMEVLSTNNLNDTQSSNFLLQENTNAIKSLDVANPTGAALGYIQVYEIVNPNKDWVKDFDTGINVTDFVIVPISAVYDIDLKLDNGGNEGDNFSLPYTATFISGGTWHIIADYPMVANVNGAPDGTWIITTLIFSRDLSKQLGVVNIPMGSGTTGSAITPIID